MRDLNRRFGARRASDGVCLMLVSLALASCVTQGDPPGLVEIWVLNDSPSPVTVEVHSPRAETIVVPAHVYGPVFSGFPADGAGWTLGLVDAGCTTLMTWRIDGQHNLMYVAPTGDTSLTNGLAFEFGLRSASSATLADRVPACS